MEYLALSIFLSTVLFLVDKNHAWRGFWRFSKWAGVAVLALVIAGAGYYSYQQHQAKKYDSLAAQFGGSSEPCH